MVRLHNSIGRIENLLSFSNNKDERAAIAQILKRLGQDHVSALKMYKTKKIKAINIKAFEIVKGDLRIFYSYKGEDLVILHIARKQKNKTEQKDLKLVEQRAKSI
ncbi:Phage-related protein [[Clostridium] sordellii]|uniref:type II toxin-antitoxin system RelE/ParE family toxin n=1 Tax=Paraclostridium sordellii TaxID=1505 RepID=UPI0005E214BE|nr:type II toxin-antitoxin system RelE/ParE family toxin [Paeniclostridium sordellii]CEP46412.1 Phage-related protein [[Clostridium] sordellii] [Paeniclostridium sordellii]CEQ26614.1 Phage-related protein [[Clostridium] sordellii] [Paeniclostridium sordellii]